MQPVNTKSLFSMLCKTIEKLDNKEISANDAMAISKVCAQANQLLNYELKRAVLMSNEDVRKHHRNIEIKSFDSLPEAQNGHVVYAEIEGK